ncbi:hypothetical protein D4R75_11025 [bacterium]|nr:MAG: hypothetical protein D4R75_11025 [bacterium]
MNLINVGKGTQKEKHTRKRPAKSEFRFAILILGDYILVKVPEPLAHSPIDETNPFISLAESGARTSILIKP